MSRRGLCPSWYGQSVSRSNERHSIYSGTPPEQVSTIHPCVVAELGGNVIDCQLLDLTKGAPC